MKNSRYRLILDENFHRHAVEIECTRNRSSNTLARFELLLRKPQGISLYKKATNPIREDATTIKQQLPKDN